MSTAAPLCCLIVVTGRGVVSSIGSSLPEFETSLAEAKGGIDLHDSIFPGRAVYAGLARPYERVPGLETAAPGGHDRTAQMAAAAVAQALREAGLWDGGKLGVAGERVALLLGSSHGGRAQLDRFVEAGMDADDVDLARGVMERAAHHHQTAVLATLFGVHGPVNTMSTACSSSGMAMAHGVELLRSGRVDVVIAGGADAFSKLTHAGFTALGAVANNGPCGPFGRTIGMTLGEGSAFVVLERADNARERGARAWGELFGCGTSWDAHHLTTPEPSGDGMRRAIGDALALSGVHANEVDYINAHATGTRANDISETLAIKRVFEAVGPPPISATKSFTGHMLGASSAIGFITGLSAMHSGKLPSTLNFVSGRPGCDLDYVPDALRLVEVKRFLSHSAAFGGANCVMAGGRHEEMREPVLASEAAIVISGLGVISPLGCDAASFFDALLTGQSAGSAPEDTALAAHAPMLARVVGFDPRRHLPASHRARMSRITQYAVAAIEQALQDADLPANKRRSTGVGLMVGLCRGVATSYDAYLQSVRGAQWVHASPTAFPNLVMSSVGGQAAIAIGLKGVASTVVGGAEVALTLLSNAAECLLRRSDIDAIVVVAADELAPLYLHLDHTRRGALPPLPPAEGAVALLLERRERAAARGARARAELVGWAQTFDAAVGPALATDGGWLEQAVRQALARAESAPQAVDLAFTLARAEVAYDKREAAVWQRLFGDAPPALSALAGHTGVAEAAGGLYAAAAAIQALEQGRMPAPAGALATALAAPWLRVPAQGAYAQAMVAGSGDMGGNAAIVLRRPTAGA